MLIVPHGGQTVSMQHLTVHVKDGAPEFIYITPFPERGIARSVLPPMLIFPPVFLRYRSVFGHHLEGGFIIHPGFYHLFDLPQIALHAMDLIEAAPCRIRVVVVGVNKVDAEAPCLLAILLQDRLSVSGLSGLHVDDRSPRLNRV
jgi:hypothetical protein